MAKVYVVNNGGHDYSDAERFGEVVFCTDAFIRRDDTGLMYRALHEALKDAEPEDYLMMSSLTSMCVVASGILVEKFGQLNMLILHNQQYTARKVVFCNEAQA